MKPEGKIYIPIFFPFIVARDIFIIKASDLRFLTADDCGGKADDDADDDDGHVDEDAKDEAAGNDELSRKELSDIQFYSKTIDFLKTK